MHLIVPATGSADREKLERRRSLQGIMKEGLRGMDDIPVNGAPLEECLAWASPREGVNARALICLVMNDPANGPALTWALHNAGALDLDAYRMTHRVYLNSGPDPLSKLTDVQWLELFGRQPFVGHDQIVAGPDMPVPLYRGMTGWEGTARLLSWTPNPLLAALYTSQPGNSGQVVGLLPAPDRILSVAKPTGTTACGASWDCTDIEVVVDVTNLTGFVVTPEFEFSVDSCPCEQSPPPNRWVGHGDLVQVAMASL